ncbi:hypothetical protein JB92DRAFT_3040936 [Gautieria morchelliformis]|nr:hypothetical protein JB92DRAFT_3040936 [Gautieria morchelliformis]
MRLWLAAASGIRWGFLCAILSHPSLLQLSCDWWCLEKVRTFVRCPELPTGLCTSSRLDSRSLLSTVQLWLTGATRDAFVRRQKDCYY